MSTITLTRETTASTVPLTLTLRIRSLKERIEALPHKLDDEGRSALQEAMKDWESDQDFAIGCIFFHVLRGKRELIDEAEYFAKFVKPEVLDLLEQSMLAEQDVDALVVQGNRLSEVYEGAEHLESIFNEALAAQNKEIERGVALTERSVQIQKQYEKAQAAYKAVVAKAQEALK
jgi:hypothetical protein